MTRVFYVYEELDQQFGNFDGIIYLDLIAGDALRSGVKFRDILLGEIMAAIVSGENCLLIDFNKISGFSPFFTRNAFCQLKQSLTHEAWLYLNMQSNSSESDRRRNQDLKKAFDFACKNLEVYIDIKGSVDSMTKRLKDKLMPLIKCDC